MDCRSRRFTRASRLRNAKEFGRVFAEPFRSSSRTVTVLARPNGSNSARLGLAIAKKHIRRAVDRNRLKRLVRDDFRHHRQALGGLDIVVLARRGLDKESKSQLRCALKSHWQRLIVFGLEHDC